MTNPENPPLGPPQNPLHERYASAEMGSLFSAQHRFRTWRRIWILLAETQAELGLAISPEQLASLRRAADKIDLDRVAELERQTRHDVVAHIRHFAEEAGVGGGIIHLGATSAFITDNTDAVLIREALQLVRTRLARVILGLRKFSLEWAELPCLAYTHFQPAQLTTVGKRASLWLQDYVEDLAAIEGILERQRTRGAKGTTGTQASFLTLFDGDHEKVRALDSGLAQKLGFAASWAVTGQTYPRKQDSQTLTALAGIAETSHKFGTDLRLLQGVGELSEPFGKQQVGSSAMAYKRNPVKAERMCGLARRIMTDAISGWLNTSTQWLERSLDDSSNRRLVITDSFLAADAVLSLAGTLAAGLTVNQGTIAARVGRELPFMATETLLMEGVKRGGDRQLLHEALRTHSLAAQASLAEGGDNTLLAAIAADSAFAMSRAEIDASLDARAFVGRSAEQTREMAAIAEESLRGVTVAPVEEPRI